MNRILHEVIADILAYHGAIVEKAEDGCLDVIAPPEVSKVLNTPEYTRLCFSHKEPLPLEKIIYASYDSDFFNSIGKLLEDKGKFAIVSLEPVNPKIEKIVRKISEELILANATFRLGKIETGNVSYLLIYFKYVALSDERHEGILSVLVNEMTLSTLPLENGVDEIMERINETDVKIETPEDQLLKALKSSYTASTGMVRERLKDFVISLERRLNRDIKRVYDYYETLREETISAIERKAVGKMEQQYLENRAKIEQMIREKRWEWNRDEKIDKLLAKLDVIETERKWKVQDLIAKYALKIQIIPMTAIRITARTPIFWINIKRRLASRQFPLSYNPVVKHLDALPCESCFNPQGVYYICDDNLHIICANCFKACPHCGKRYCRVCHGEKCPKCTK